MRTIHFKKGETKEISQIELETIVSHMKDKPTKLEAFMDGDKIYLVINVEEILFID